MLPRQKVAMMVICVVIFIVILDLVRRRKLKEEYSWLWLLTSVALFFLVFRYGWLELITQIMGAVLPTTTLFIGALIFLMLLSIQFSIKISKLTDQVKNVVQENSLLRQRLEEFADRGEDQSPGKRGSS